jgi:hypothetical protein
MPSRDVQILRQFTQKLAGQYKKANPLMDPQVLGMLGGGALTGLGAYGLARSMQSDEDRENGSMMPMLAGLAGAGAGAYGGYHGGGYLADMLKRYRANQDMQRNFAATVNPQPEIVDSVNGPVDLNNQGGVSFQTPPNMGATDTSVSPESAEYLRAIEAGQPKPAPANPAANIKGQFAARPTRSV